MTSVDEISNEVLPQVYKLNQNYPNPFNPSTTISYSLPKAEKVRLTIYNLIGQQVEVLINKKQTPGEYRIIWDSQDLPSGLYFYELKTENFTQRKKMILIR